MTLRLSDGISQHLRVGDPPPAPTAPPPSPPCLVVQIDSCCLVECRRTLWPRCLPSDSPLAASVPSPQDAPRCMDGMRGGHSCAN